MKKFLVFGLCLLCLGITNAPRARAQGSVSTFAVTGEAEMTSGSQRSVAYKSALDVGLRQAVNQYILQKLGGDAALMAEKQAVIDGKILPNANLYVRNYQIQNEQIRDGKIFLKIQTEILVDSLKRDLMDAGVFSENTPVMSSTEVEMVVQPGSNYRRLVLLRQFLAAHPEWVKTVRTAELLPKQVVLGLELNPAANIDGLVQVLSAESFLGSRPKITQSAPQKLDVTF